MTFTEIYNRIIPLWPATISVADAVLIEPRSKPKKNQLLMPNLTNSFYSENLTKAWTSAREASATEDNYGRLMVWTMYELLNRKLKQDFENGITEITPAGLNKTELEEQFYQNLQEEGTEEE